MPTKWDDTAKQYLTQHYRDMSIKDLAEYFGSTEKSITVMLSKMQLKRRIAKPKPKKQPRFVPCGRTKFPDEIRYALGLEK